jgi:hypothetical protein
MVNVFTRALQSRGIYSGSYESKTVGGEVLPRPAFFVILNRPNVGMVRLEVGIGQRSLWADWGRHDHDTH